ncbi:PQQ-dependent dehydrogenase, methanol/ethanol family [Kineobactrum salinum]|uniref:PQQ-dependent dehydrogenase, methanol/ethanol family n=1 Tax=Kineobactrum salinum TaxID=2708301 RepID=A0A6C0U3U1_9GAMM|nr:PQQ-dependent dehydrogenase, methanol/ethanol family [Kineobactrum salinum]QIB66832.1 PQQ-dependent dehydrogenase, methanol/ethanol family [Kineobactrum salinum]
MMHITQNAIPLILIIAASLYTAGNSAGESNAIALDEWPFHGGSPLEQRFSPYSQVNVENISDLGLAWSFEFNSKRGQEATPIVVDGVMYVSTAWSRVYALNAVSGEMLWHFDPQVSGATAFKACCDVVNRGVAVSEGRVFLGALDGRLIALNAKTGKLLWSVDTIDPDKAYTITGAPRVFDDKVIIGNGGAEYGVRGYVTAYNASTGREVWRFYTVPGAPDAEADGAASDQILRELALPTWHGDWYKYGGGGTVWDSIVYDPELHQLYIGVGNGSPWNHQVRSDGKGDNLFLASIIALDPDTGAYKWHYQQNPGESWDFTATQQMILATWNMGGRDRKVLMQAPKNGFFYVIDRSNGELISAENFVPVNWASGIDKVTGRPIENPEARYREAPFVMRPNALGAHSWHPMAYNPEKQLVYIPIYHSLFAYGNEPDFKFQPGIWNNAIDQALLQVPDDPEEMRKGSAGFEGRLLAWDPVAQKEVWSVRHPTMQNGGVLATAGHLVFQGTGTGWFEARHADTGKLLWRFDARDGIIAGPVSYQPNGTQYVALVAGYGGAFGIGEGVDTPKIRPNGRVLVFSLNGAAELPLPTKEVLFPLDPPETRFTEVQIDRGRLLYTTHCYRCHGAGAQSTGVLPDLRRSPALANNDYWRAILIDGVLASKGMVSFAEWMTSEEIESVRAYVVHKARIAQEQEAKKER